MPENIHDKGYKRILSKKRNFLDLLKHHIKAQWVDRIHGEDEPMIYAIEQMIDEIEENAREAGEKTGREAGEKAGREAGEKAGREAGEKKVIALLEQGYSVDQIKEILKNGPLSE
jgi:predicted transposase YdaD